MTKLRRGATRHGLAVVIVITLLVGAALAGIATQAATGAARVTRMIVTEREYRITLTRRSFKPGMVTFVVQNRGKLGHQFSIRGPGMLLPKRIPGTIAPGMQRVLTVRLRAGIYTLWCPIHIALGMKTTIKVA